MKTHETHPLAGFGTARGPVLSLLFLCLALTASAKIFEWRLNSPQARAETFTAYHGETIRFNPIFAGLASNIVAEAIYYTTNGIASIEDGSADWFKTDGLVFHPTNDCGLASYRFFLRGIDPEGVNYTANGLLRMLPSPGFEPAALPLPVKTLDFALTEVVNPPYYTKSETDAKIVELAPTPDLSQATNYTDSVAANLREGLAVAASSATNYTDNVATTLRGEIAAATPEDYDTVKSNATVAAEAVAGLGDLAWIDGLEWSAIIDRPTTWAWSAISGKPTTWAWSNISDKPSWIGDTKPTYSLNDVCPNVENWLGVPGTTSAGKSIKVLAKTVNGVIEGGLTVTGSSNNDNNATRYRYAGVTVTRNGANTDYLFDTASQSGVVRRSELAAITPGDYATVSNRAVNSVQTSALSSLETDPTVSSWAKASSKPTYAYSEITGKPTLAAVATSGSYNDLRDKPEIGGDYVSTNETGSIILHRYFNDAPYSSGLVGMSPGLYSRDYDGEDYNYAPCLFVSYSENGGGTRELSTNYWAGLSFDAIHVARTDSDPYSASLYFPTSSGTIALTSDIPEYTETNAVSTIVWHYGAETLTIPSGGTLSASTTGWKNGESMFLVLSPSGSYTVDANAVDLVGYNAWPTNTTLCVAFRYGSKILVNPITATE